MFSGLRQKVSLFRQCNICIC